MTEIAIMSARTRKAMPDADFNLPRSMEVVIDHTFPYGTILIADKDWYEHRNDPPPFEIQRWIDRMEELR